MNIRKNFVLSICLMVLGGLLLPSCIKNDDANNETIVLIGPENYIDDILSVIPDTLQLRFFADFGEIPQGPVPPKIDGSYVVSPKQRVSSNDSIWPIFIEDNMYLRFSKQHNGIVTLDLNEAMENVTDTVFVQGNGNKFVVYFIEDLSYDMELDQQMHHINLRRGVIMKGQVTNIGLADFRYATIILDVDCDGSIVPFEKGMYYIYKDGDGIAENFDW